MTMNDLLLTQGLSGAAYPDTWDEFIGQDRAKRQLRTAAQAAQKRNVPLPHVLLASGTPGIGKTTLALLTALEMNTRLAVVSGRMRLNDARITLSGLEDRDILFIDEIHRLVEGGKGGAEWLLHLLSDGVLMGPTGPEAQPHITVIGATTDVAKLPETLTSRFPLRPILTPYDDIEASMIAMRMAQRVMLIPLPFPKAGCFRRIARASNNNPRTIGMILSNLRDIALVDEDTIFDEVDGYDLTEALGWLGLDEDGLTDTARRYLSVLLHDLGGQGGERAIADRLREVGLAETERLLMDKGYIAKTRAGRVLTKAGIRKAKELTA